MLSKIQIYGKGSWAEHYKEGIKFLDSFCLDKLVGLPTALITGASRGIGKAIAIQLSKDHGLHILINYSSDTVAAYQVAGRIDMLIFLPIFAIAGGLTTLVGMFYGARRFDLIKPIINYALKWSVIFSLIATFIFFFLSNYIIYGFT